MITLLVWEIVPEETKMYLIPNEVISNEMREHLEKAHGKLINADDDTHSALVLNAALTPKDSESSG